MAPLPGCTALDTPLDKLLRLLAHKQALPDADYAAYHRSILNDNTIEGVPAKSWCRVFFMPSNMIDATLQLLGPAARLAAVPS